ncbi:MAG: hypothetical protein KJ792_14830 [Actinobacteria bacterium]|nr:hypothetical protein [Actinomycetota bacterium]
MNQDTTHGPDEPRPAIELPGGGAAGGSGGTGRPGGTPDEEPPAWAAELAPRSRRRVHPVTVGLLAAVLLVGGFVGGVALQRGHQSTTTSASGRGFRFAGGAPTGGAVPGAQATPGAGRGQGGGGFAGGGTPAVSGAVTAVGDGTLTVQPDGGSAVTVRVSAATTVSERGSTSLQVGAQVQVMGTKAGDGSVDATAVVTRRGA